MTAAYVTPDDKRVSLDGRGASKTVVTAKDVQDPELLARLLGEALADLADLRSQWNPRTVYFRDVAVDGTGSVKYPFEHRFGGRVNYTVVRWKPTTLGDPHDLEVDASTTDDRLVLVSGWAGVATVRVEEAG